MAHLHDAEQLPRPGSRNREMILRWTARLTSVLSTGVLLLFLFGEGDWAEMGQITPAEWVGLALFPLGVMIGMMVAWWKEGAGALLGLAALAGFYLWNVAIRGSLPRGPYFLLLALPLFLFAAAAYLARARSP